MFSVIQAIPIGIILQQIWLLWWDCQSVVVSKLILDAGSSPNLNLLYEFAARTATMAIVSLLVLISQKPRYFLVVLLMNIFREGQETVIDPLFPLLNAPASPAGDLAIHLVIIAIELWAFITVFKMVRKMDRASFTD